MTPHFCGFHQHYTDGECKAGKRSLNRNDLAIRIADIDFMLGDGEEAQSRGYSANKALEVERVTLEALRDVLP